MKWLNRARRAGRQAVAAEIVGPLPPVAGSPLWPEPAMSLKDFTVTVDTERSKGDMLVVNLDREGMPRLSLPFGAQQFLWALGDAEYFQGGYRTWIATNIVAVHTEQGLPLAVIAQELGCTEAQATDAYAKAVAEAEKEARELAEVGA